MNAVARKAAEQMATAALAWLDALSPEQRKLAAFPAPGRDAAGTRPNGSGGSTPPPTMAA